MERIRVAWRTVAGVLVTALAALVPAIVRRLSFGARRPTAWVGSRCCRIWARALCAILGIRRKIEGRPEGAVFAVAANHLSYLDILVLGSLYPTLFVAKKEIAGWPLFGWVTRNCGTLFVDRDRARDVVQAARAVERHLLDGLCVTLFPEGQATRGDAVLPFRAPLLEPMARHDVGCYSASLSYATPGVDDPPSMTVCWWGGVEFLPHILRLLRIGTIEATVRFSPAPIRAADRKLLAERLYDEVCSRFTPVRQVDRAERKSTEDRESIART